MAAQIDAYTFRAERIYKKVSGFFRAAGGAEYNVIYGHVTAPFWNCFMKYTGNIKLIYRSCDQDAAESRTAAGVLCTAAGAAWHQLWLLYHAERNEGKIQNICL